MPKFASQIPGMPQTVTARIRAYRFDVSSQEQGKRYDEMVSHIKKMNKGRTIACHKAIASESFERLAERHAPGCSGADVQIEIETEHLFADQWNTQDKLGGMRVHLWAQNVWPNRSIRSGYYLTIDDDVWHMLTEHAGKCAYCGAYHPADRIGQFCGECFGSQHLKFDDLRLTRVMPLKRWRDLPPLADAERAEIEPIYRAEQIRATNDRTRCGIASRKERLIAEYNRERQHNAIEFEGHLWLLEHCPWIDDNAIYYKHTGRWCFGWRNALSAQDAERLRTDLVGFTGEFDVKAAR